MTNFKKQIFALAYLSFLCNLIYSDSFDNNSNFDSPKQNYKKCSCDFKSCDNKRSRDCCKKHKKDVKSYEKKLGIIRGTVSFNGPVNASFTVSQTPIPGSSPAVYPVEATINPDLKFITKGNCFTPSNLQIEALYGPKSPYTTGGIIIYSLTIDIAFKKRFKDIPTVVVSSNDLVTEQVLEQGALLGGKSLTFSFVNKAINITNKGFQIFKLIYAFVAPLPDNSDTITLSQGAQEEINLVLNILNMPFIATGELCD